MRCEQASDLMSARLDRRAIDDQALDQHLNGCPRCRGEWSAVQRVARLFDRPSFVYPPADFTLRVMARVAQRPAPMTQVNPWRSVGGWLVLLVGAGLIGLLFMSPLALDTWRAWQSGGLALTWPTTLIGLGFQLQALAVGVLKAVESLLSFVPTPVVLGYMLTATLLVTVWVAILGHARLRTIA